MAGLEAAHQKLMRRAEIKKAEGIKQAKNLEAEGEVLAIQLVNQAADKLFVGNAQILRRLITVETALATNAKFVVPMNAELVNVIGDMAGVVPLGRGTAAERPHRAATATVDPSVHSFKGNGG